MARTMPRLPVGTIPNASFSVRADEFYLTKVGLITRVDEVNLKADIKILSGGERFEIDLTQAMAGPRSFWGGIPEKNSIVILGYRRIHKSLFETVILGYLPVGHKSGARFDPWAPDDPSTIEPGEADEAGTYAKHLGGTLRYKRLQLKSGDVGGMSCRGAEFALTADVQMTNRAGDLFEIRDADRTLVQQSIHRIEGEAGIKRVSGPLRRSAFYLPDDIMQGGTGRQLPDEATRLASGYYGQDELERLGPGDTLGTFPKFCQTDGKLQAVFNNYQEFIPTTYSDGRKAHYPPTLVGVDIEDPKGGADAFVEQRTELSHTTNMSQDVLEEVDGFNIDQRSPYIEHVLGTLVGNDMFSTGGLRQYGRLLKPKLFSDFRQLGPGKFELTNCKRGPLDDLESQTAAGAYLFRIRPPRSNSDSCFAMAVTKEGKFLLQAPGSKVEDFPSGSNNLSGEVSLEGALKVFLGASNPDKVSLFLNFLGGISGEIGHDAAGRAIDIKYRSAVRTEYKTTTPTDDTTGSSGVGGVAFEQIIKGGHRVAVVGKSTQQFSSAQVTVDGGYQAQCDRYSLNAFGGFSGNYGELNQLVAGKSQLNYALQVLETIVAGGKITTVLAGGLTQTVTAGAITTTAAAGATTFNNPAGAFTVNVGAGAISLTTGAGAVSLATASGAMSLAAAAGAMSLSAGLAVNITAGVAFSVVSPQYLMGGPAAVLGVARGVPTLPPGTPTLDPLTGLPVLGSALFRSI